MRHRRFVAVVPCCFLLKGPVLFIVLVSLQGRSSESQPSSAEVLGRIAGVLGVSWLDLLDKKAPENHDMVHTEQLFLKEIYSRMLEWEYDQDGQIPLEVDSLAIDMYDGIEFIQSTVAHTKSLGIRFRIAMLKGPSETLIYPGISSDKPESLWVKEWSDHAIVTLKRIKQFFGPIGFGHPGKVVTAEIRTYDALPTIHGFKATKGDAMRLGYTNCKLVPGNPDRYDWGDGDYELCVSESPQEFAAKTAEWQKRFNELWASGKAEWKSLVD